MGFSKLIRILSNATVRRVHRSAVAVIVYCSFVLFYFTNHATIYYVCQTKFSRPAYLWGLRKQLLEMENQTSRFSATGEINEHLQRNLTIEFCLWVFGPRVLNPAFCSSSILGCLLHVSIAAQLRSF